MKMREIKHMGTKMRGKKKIIKGIAMGLCLAMLAPAAAVMMPGVELMAGQTGDQNPTDPLKKAKDEAADAFEDWMTNNNVTSDHAKISDINRIISEAKDKIGKLQLVESVNECRNNTLVALNNVINPPVNNDDDDDDDEEDPPVNPDHFLMVGGSWMTPVANAGEAVSIVLPVVNMGKTMVTDAVVTPVLSTETGEWPFEITSSNYSQTIKDLPGTDTGMSDMDRRRELTWNLKTRSDVGNGYQKLTFNVVYRDSDGKSQSTTLDTYIQLSGTAGVGADGKASVPRVIVTGFETNPQDVHAGESFVLTLHLKNTSTATSVNNMIFEIVAAVEGKDEDTT